MENLRVGDIVTRKSYGGDLYFKIIDIRKRDDGKRTCILRGVMYRIEADADMDDLQVQNSRQVFMDVQREMARIRGENNYRLNNSRIIPVFGWMRGRTGTILHIDASSDFMNRCIDTYKEAGIRAFGKTVKESDQPEVVKRLLEQTRADILILTGHDSMKKNGARNSLDSYSNSRYFIDAVKIARKYQSDKNKLFIFAGACQSYYEAIMEQGANYASSPGRILIHALDPAIVCEKIALTDNRRTVNPSEIIPLTKSGSQGIGGVPAKGHYIGK